MSNDIDLAQKDLEDVKYVYDKAQQQATTNQLVVVLNTANYACCKVEREDYYPNDDGVIDFHKKLDWREPGYSVGEILELLFRYQDKIKKITFEAVDGVQYAPINVQESDTIGDALEFSCFITVGDSNSVMKIYGNPLNANWMVDNIRRPRSFNR